MRVSRLGQDDEDSAGGRLVSEDLTVYEYLARAGLAHYTAGFEHHGYIQTSAMLAAGESTEVTKPLAVQRSAVQ